MAIDVESLVARFAENVEAAAGSHVRSLVLYGSAASGEFVPGRSDVNSILVADQVTLPLLEGLQKQIGSWRRRRIAIPLVIDTEFLATSTDSYPLEILGMMAAYRVLKGADPFQDLRIDGRDVRLQAEREVKAKELLLRRGFIESGGKSRPLAAYLTGATPAVEAILRGLLFVRGDEAWRKTGPGFREACGRTLSVDRAALDRMREIRSGRKAPARPEIVALYGRALDLLASLSKLVEG